MKKFFIVTLMALLVACTPAATAATRDSLEEIPVSGVQASSTSSPLPSKTKTARLKTPTPPPTTAACLQLIRPANGVHLPKDGNVDFAWETHPRGQLYVFTLISADGHREDSRTGRTKLSYPIRATDPSGAYYWSVSAYDAKGYFICNSGFIAFLKGTVSGTGRETYVAVSETGRQGSGTTGETDGQAPAAADESNMIPPLDLIPLRGTPVYFDPYIPPDNSFAPPAPNDPSASAATDTIPSQPPATDPAATEPSFVVPPIVEPPATEPVATEPPAAEPAPTDPPAVEPAPSDPPVDPELIPSGDEPAPTDAPF